MKHKKYYGFTIVELLIVIVVIGVLAAISVAAYSGIQQRAKNTAIISAANQSLKLINAYIAETGKYPPTTGAGDRLCVTVSSGCMDGGGLVTNLDAVFNTAFATLGNLPQSAPTEGASAYGIAYSYRGTRTYNGDVQPAILQYFLIGHNRQCGAPNVSVANWSVGAPSSTGYSRNLTASGVNKTECIISIPGPSA